MSDPIIFVDNELGFEASWNVYTTKYVPGLSEYASPYIGGQEINSCLK